MRKNCWTSRALRTHISTSTGPACYAEIPNSSAHTVRCYQTASRSFTCEYPDYALYDFEQVIALDPSVKEAYAGRAVAYANIHGLDDNPKTEEFYHRHSTLIRTTFHSTTT